MPVNLLDKISFSLKEGLVFKLSRVLPHRGPYQHRGITTVLPLLTPTPSLWDSFLSLVKASTSLTTGEKLFTTSVSLSDYFVIVFFSFQVPLYLHERRRGTGELYQGLHDGPVRVCLSSLGISDLIPCHRFLF